jgi:hypothetical protein
MSLNPEDIEAFQLFSAETFDPSIFEGFDQSPWDDLSSASAVWNGSTSGV